MVLNNKNKKNKMSTDGIIMYLNIHNFLNTYPDRARALNKNMYTNKKKKMVAAFHAKKKKLKSKLLYKIFNQVLHFFKYAI